MGQSFNHTWEPTGQIYENHNASENEKTFFAFIKKNFKISFLNIYTDTYQLRYQCQERTEAMNLEHTNYSKIAQFRTSAHRQHIGHNSYIPPDREAMRMLFYEQNRGWIPLSNWMPKIPPPPPPTNRAFFISRGTE